METLSHIQINVGTDISNLVSEMCRTCTIYTLKNTNIYINFIYIRVCMNTLKSFLKISNILDIPVNKHYCCKYSETFSTLQFYILIRL